MLELRPTCKNCNKLLAPNSTEAMICTYECTFCADCVENILFNVCPNCGGGFFPRPFRPKDELINNPPSTKIVYKPVDPEKHTKYAAGLKNIPPEER